MLTVSLPITARGILAECTVAAAAELSQHLRSQSPNPQERRQLMSEIRTLREKVENQREEEEESCVTLSH